MSSTSQIAEFYRNRSVFITGGTGFLGKVLVEKLLRSCPDIEAIYLLMRRKKCHSNVYDRLIDEFHNHIVSVHHLFTYINLILYCIHP